MPTARETLIKANNSAEKAEKSIDKTISKSDEKVQRAIAVMESQATALVRSMLVSNYGSSGVKTKTGKLKDALNNAIVKILIRGRNPRLVIMMPKNISAYDKKDGGGNFYEAAAAVNYGALRASKEKNVKRRRAMKTKLQRSSVGKTAVTQGHIITTVAETQEGSKVAAGGTSATKGFHFWELSAEQQVQVRDLVMRIFTDMVLKRIAE